MENKSKNIKQYLKDRESHKCESGVCIYCEKEFDCLFWHEVTVHNMPYGWHYFGAEYEKEMIIHMGHLWEQLLNAFSGEKNLTFINDSYLGEFMRIRKETKELNLDKVKNEKQNAR